VPLIKWDFGGPADLIVDLACGQTAVCIGVVYSMGGVDHPE
jgi:hypothetical protein